MTDSYLKNYADAGLYLMQGRLTPPEDGRFQSFPRSHWQGEIALAAQVPLRGIEWIFDHYGMGANPLESAGGRAELRALLTQAGVSVVSICADYFMDCPLLRIDAETLAERVQKLRWLISVCPEMGVGRVVLPFVDASRIAGSRDRADVLAVLGEVLPDAETASVELHLETDLNPADFRELLREIPHPLVKVNYDSGNSSGLGYLPAEEFAAYGERIGSFHIKDRVLGGGTVPLGTGSADFASLRRQLLAIEYQGDFVMQVARGAAGAELSWLQQAVSSACDWLRGTGDLV